MYAFPPSSSCWHAPGRGNTCPKKDVIAEALAAVLKEATAAAKTARLFINKCALQSCWIRSPGEAAVHGPRLGEASVSACAPGPTRLPARLYQATYRIAPKRTRDTKSATTWHVHRKGPTRLGCRNTWFRKSVSSWDLVPEVCPSWRLPVGPQPV